MSKITSSGQLSSVKAEEFQRFVSIWIAEAHGIINGNLGFDNFKSQSASVVFLAPNSEVAVPHNLGRPPAGYLVTSLNAAMVVFNGASASDQSNLYLQSSAAGTAGIIIF